MVKVSIVVPIYNTQDYIKKCLESLVNQTLKDIEIICVNDGSTDNTMVIVNEFAKNDNRIKIIEQTNQKQGAARNNGMRSAQGEYIGFVDSDDWVDLNYYEKLYNSAKKYDTDIALAVNVRIGNGKTKKRLNIANEAVYTEIQDRFDVCNLAKNPCPTNKIYKKSLLDDNKITYPEGCYCEDKLFVIQAVYYAKNLVSVPGVNYYYYRNPHSTVNTRLKKHIKCLIEDKNNSKRAVLDFLKNNNAQLRDKEFWAIKKDYRFLGLNLYRIKESLKTEKHLLFGIFPIREVNV